jgi:SNF2 family DNA or RNA helicase
VVSDIEMNQYERKVYNAVFYNIMEYSRNDYMANYEFVDKLRRGRVIRLRQCLSYTYLVKTAVDDYQEQIVDETMLTDIVMNYDRLEKPSKLLRLIDLVTEFQEKDQKVVIWSYFIGTIKMIEKELAAKGFLSKKIIGETPSEKTNIEDQETREIIKNEFIDPNSGLDILLANPAACAESISLHKTCHNAIYYDLSYNGAQFLQSLDRIHRVGGSEDKEAHYYFLQYASTMENRILYNLEKKRDKMYQIIEGDFNIYSLDMFEGLDELDDYEAMFLDNDS